MGGRRLLVIFIITAIFVGGLLTGFYFYSKNSKDKKHTTTKKTTTINTTTNINTTKTTTAKSTAKSTTKKVTTKKKTTTKVTTTVDNTLYNVSFDVNEGTGTYSNLLILNGNKIDEPTEPERTGYSFMGWFYNNKLWDFDNDVISGETLLTAMWEINKYKVTINNLTENIIIDGVESGSSYDYNSEITLTSPNIPKGTILKWIIDDEVIYSNDYSFIIPLSDMEITVNLETIYIRDNNTIYFGYYPQTLVTDEEIKSSLNALTGELPTSEDPKDWIDYNYYINGNIVSYMWYIDIDLDNDSRFDYRGVYFTKYRSKETPGYPGSYNDKNGYLTKTVYWFKYEPIKWHIFEEENGNAFIVSELAIDSQCFNCTNDYYNEFEHNGGVGYANNYALSDIRIWLNEDFYNTSFSKLLSGYINETLVDNSVNQAYEGAEEYCCDDTLDKVFLLSYKEIMDYYPTEEDRKIYGTDYAKAQGLVVETDKPYNGSSTWLGRSPNPNSDTMQNSCRVTLISADGIYYYQSGLIYNTARGIRPAMWIKL